MKETKNTVDTYEDIIHLPHHVSAVHPQMTISDRAAQFSPFAALTGYGSAIRETERLTDRRTELDESEKEILNEMLLLLAGRLKEHPVITVTYFVPDERKDGGSYVTVSGNVRKLDEVDRAILLDGGRRVPVEDIVELGGDVFSESLFVD